MPDFEITPPEYPHIREVMFSLLPDFASSPAYERLSEHDRGLPTVVTGAFARYINELLTGSEGERDVSRQLRAGFNVIERLASSPDPEVQNALIVEVYEHLDLTDDESERFQRQLGPASKALYARWMAD